MNGASDWLREHWVLVLILIVVAVAIVAQGGVNTEGYDANCKYGC